MFGDEVCVASTDKQELFEFLGGWGEEYRRMFCARLHWNFQTLVNKLLTRGPILIISVDRKRDFLLSITLCAVAHAQPTCLV